MHRTLAVALVAALALALASCGGSETKTETVTRAQAISRLEAACLAGQRAAGRQANPKSGEVSFSEAIIANLRTIEDRVGNLEISGPAQKDLDAYMDTVRVRLDAFEKIVAADAGDRQAVIRSQRDAIRAAGLKAHQEIVALGARHVCI